MKSFISAVAIVAATAITSAQYPEGHWQNFAPYTPPTHEVGGAVDPDALPDLRPYVRVIRNLAEWGKQLPRFALLELGQVGPPPGRWFGAMSRTVRLPSRRTPSSSPPRASIWVKRW